MPKIKIRGVIVGNDDQWIYDYFDMESVSPKNIESALNEAKGETMEVEISSGGGSVIAGSEIYSMLKSYSGEVKIQITGIAASAASVIAMAGDFVEIAPTAQIMIHNVSSMAAGDYRDFEHEAEVIKNYNKSIANAYILKTALTEDELLAMMDNETWLNAQQAKEKGFVDAIMFDNGMQLVASTFGGHMIPTEIIDRMRNDRMNDADNKKKMELCRAKLNLLKLEGKI